MSDHDNHEENTKAQREANLAKAKQIGTQRQKEILSNMSDSASRDALVLRILSGYTYKTPDGK